MGRIKGAFSAIRGDGLKARVLRGSGMTIIQVGGSNFLRLMSNLILTRLLFPEAFGLMALTQIFIYGLQMFSDVGIRTMLIQSKRGAEPRFMDTLWTMQIIRGFLMWLAACLVAVPAAWIYDQPVLKYLLPVVAFSLVVEGFKTTKEALAMRDVNLERVILLQLLAQFIGLISLVLLAFWLRSVWALAFGMIVSAFVKVVLLQKYLPGHNNSLCWDWGVVRETVSFGVFIFFSTVCSFFNNMGAQMVLGVYVPAAVLGMYSIANTLGTLPGVLALAMANNVIFPLYRITPPSESPENQRSVFRMRRLLCLGSIVATACLALIGDWVVNLLFDPRYAYAGPILILIALRSLPIFGAIGTNQALIGSGDSKRNFILTMAMALSQMAVLLIFLPIFGLPAAVLAETATFLITYPLRSYLTHKHASWDRFGEISLMLFGVVLALLIGWIKWDVLAQLFTTSTLS